MKKLALLAALPFLLIGCGEPTLEAGTITKKVHEPERTWVQIIPIYSGQSCSGSVCTPIYSYLPFIHKDDEDWRLELETPTEKGRLYVSEETFNSVEVGEYYSKTPDATTDEGIEKTRK
jgi:hypothetical protein